MPKSIKIIIALSAILAAGSIFYYYIIFLPGRTEQITTELVKQEKVTEEEVSKKTDTGSKTILHIIAETMLELEGSREKARDARRQSDFRQISLAMEMCFDDPSPECGGPQLYLASATMPETIGNYLKPVPKDPLEYAYSWIDNTGGNNDKFCAYALLETGKYFTASHRGVKELAEAPTTIDCR